MHRLVINPGSPQAWELELKPGPNFIGRGSDNDFTIADPSVSSKHCRIDVAEDGVTILDLGSTNGTFVNLKQVQQAHLDNDQCFRLGNVELRLQCQHAAGADEPLHILPPAEPKPASSSAEPVFVLPPPAQTEIL